MSRANPDSSELPSPAIGALLRLAWQSHRERMFDHITAEGFENVTWAQFDILRWPGIDGLRPGEIALSTGLSKQTVNDLLGELEDNGYLERHPHPEDGRARIVRLTKRGFALQRATLETSRALEAAWVAKVGERRFATLRSVLEDIAADGLPDQ